MPLKHIDPDVLDRRRPGRVRRQHAKLIERQDGDHALKSGCAGDQVPGCHGDTGS